MKIHEILERDPRTSALANTGTARITGERGESALAELRAELECFVCDGQFGDALDRILKSYLDQLDRPRQHAAWVSGFFGSGKSHLLKMLGHLWVDTVFPDGATARSLVPNLPDDTRAQLRELDTRVARSGRPAVAAAGAMPSGHHNAVRLTVLGIVLAACDLPTAYHHAQFCFWLRDNGYLEHVRGAVEKADKTWSRELNNLYASPLIACAVLECDPNFASDEKQARQVLRERFPERKNDLTTEEFIAALREALAPTGELPLTIIVLDEVQQFIGDSTDRAVMVTEMAEAVQTQLDSKVLLVASGQSALSSAALLQRLRDRFRVTVQLSDTDVEAVTRKVLLRKRPSGVAAVRDVLTRNAGEVSKHLQGTKLAERAEDRATIEADYPLLPTRRRFWEEVFRRVDAAGTRSQLRSQLQILHGALTSIADRDVGALITADALYGAIATDLVSTSVLPKEIETRIRSLGDATPAGRLNQQICGLVFFIGRLSREASMDLGMRANARTIADLLVDDLERDNGPVRAQIQAALEALAESGTLMRVNDEYRLLTTQGAEWDRAYREKLAALRQNDQELSQRRDQILAAAVQRVVDDVRITHGDSKAKRTLSLHARQDAPPASEVVHVWLRDGFNTSLKEVENEARRRGLSDATLHVFVERRSAEDLRARIAEAEAARAVIDSKGVPSEAEGREARESMNGRLASAEAARNEIIQQLVNTARVYLGGGTEKFGESLTVKLQSAAMDALARLFPRFAEADHRGWGTAVTRAREGSDQPLTAVGWDRATDEHPVAREVLGLLVSDRRGTDLHKQFETPPFGWPRDAIHAVLIALHRSGTIRALSNNQPVLVGQLDQARISSAEFRLEKVRLGTSERIAIRGLFASADVPTKSGEEELRAPQFIERLLQLANCAGGDAPLPPRPSTARIEEWKRLAGADQLAAILSSKSDAEDWIQRWKELGQRAEARHSAWETLEQLLRHARDLSSATSIASEVESIRKDRLLLDPVDHVTPLVRKLAQVLHAELDARHDEAKKAFDLGRERLAAGAAWGNSDGMLRSAIERNVGLVPPQRPKLTTDAALIAELDRESLAARSAFAASVPELVTRALAEAARMKSPAARRVSLRPATLTDEAMVRSWIAEHEKLLLDAVASGPVIVP